MARPVKKTIAIIGEGICEQYYLLSIQHLVKANIEPKIAKPGIAYLEAKVKKCIEDGYEYIFCLVDTDNKQTSEDKRKYEKFVSRYKDKVKHHSLGTTKIYVVENHPCLEIWFYYYFKHTTGGYQSYEKLNPLKPDFAKVLAGYKKEEKYFQSLHSKGGLHAHMCAAGGDFDQALARSSQSMKHVSDGNLGAFSQMKNLFDAVLKDDEKCRLSVYQKEKE